MDNRNRAYKAYNTYKNNRQNQSFWRFGNLYMWFVIILLLAISMPLYRFLKKQLNTTKEQVSKLTKEAEFRENTNPLIAQTKANKITPNKGVQAAAKSLAYDLGTKFSDDGSWTAMLNPRGWTENDANVAKTLIYQRKNFALLEKLYYNIYTNYRSLRDDILKLLDDDELKKVRKYIKI